MEGSFIIHIIHLNGMGRSTIGQGCIEIGALSFVPMITPPRCLAHLPHKSIHALGRILLGTSTGHTDKVKKKVFDSIDDFVGKLLEI